MKREIKFRVWDNVDYMSSPFTLSDLQSKQIQFTSDCEVMQFTGLKDRNGKEIYEGDILAFELTRNFNPVYEMPFVMEWDNDNAAWVNFSPKEKIVVIGNINENPELLNTNP